MNIKGAIFDLDGTLMDSMFIWEHIGEDYLISRGITPEKGLNEKFKSLSIKQAAEYYQNVYHIKDSVEEIINGVNSMIEHYYADVVKAKEGVASLLLHFKKNNIKMCIATATDKYMVEAALKNNNLLEYFSDILTCNQVGYGKDTPVIYEKSLEILGTKKDETLVFEDAVYAIETAKKAGFIVVGVEDKFSSLEKEKIQKLSDIYLESFLKWSDVYNEKSSNYCRL